ncbi:3-hydroxyacyl-CoA dehydrogenase type-2-like protein [Dinothrombium tinctorium]|uniref:3-hydroxyacyl-CoA dehydrogenase type-2 n=1 Tax=Dinothrombium tinctorium TaxID=1965070 RepID=A0A3S3NQZ3_9ACAR|nr:3-hydroxyacyl-CoA dehydrogenase type-2-like protein [Dinothrombium tinctorium]RWS07600.1 3-hydroxyacyl-CoA dehydrogenase type-2-like protein [Dinothrombium tinctorium]
MAVSGVRTVKDLVILITGASSGLGRAAVERLIQQGVRGVIAFDRSTFEHNNVTAAKRVIPVVGDVTEEKDVVSAINTCKNEFGKLDAVVNCAGVGIAMKTFNEKSGNPHDLESYEQVIKINLVGTFNMNRIACELMAKNEPINGLRGVLINTASVAAFDGQKGQVAYASSKSGVVGMTLPMARDLASLGIRVNTIAPGLFLTPMMLQLPEKALERLASTIPCPSRLGHPDEYAHLVQFIIENPMMNGETIRIDGALRMQP